MTDSLAQLDRWGARRNKFSGFMREKGLSGLVLEIKKRRLAGIFAYIVRQARYRLCKVTGQKWDSAFGVDTGGQIELESLDVAGSHRALGAPAVSTSPKTFKYLSQRFPNKLAGVTYIDVGAGKGRTLILASQLGFANVIGVEFSDALCEKAQENIALLRAKIGTESSFEIVHADATEYTLPPGDLVLYFGNPFALELWPAMIDNILRCAKQGTGRAISLMIAGSQELTIRGAGALLSGHPEFVLQERGKAPYFLDTYLPYFFEYFTVLASVKEPNTIASGQNT